MIKPRIAIVDYGMGNIKSVINAVNKTAGHVELVSDPEQLREFDKLILPGVGAFAQAINAIHRTGLADSLNEYRVSGKSILGICLGMQLMCSVSEEDGEHQGLGWVAARVTPIPAGHGYVVPHMGWNEVVFQHEHSILEGVTSGSDFYFVHSYCVQCENNSNILGATGYVLPFASMIHNENVIGMQFHPEKSQWVGLKLISNFVGS